MSTHWVITFESVHYVMKAEKVLKDNGFEVALISTPRKFSSDCGMAIELICKNLDTVKEVLSKNKLSPESFYGDKS